MEIKRLLKAFNYILTCNDSKTKKEFYTIYNLIDEKQNNNIIDTISKDQFLKAEAETKRYINNIYNLEILHNKLYNIFNSYKIGVLWLYYNFDRIRSEAL